MLLFGHSVDKRKKTMPHIVIPMKKGWSYIPKHSFFYQILKNMDVQQTCPKTPCCWETNNCIDFPLKASTSSRQSIHACSECSLLFLVFLGIVGIHNYYDVLFFCIEGCATDCHNNRKGFLTMALDTESFIVPKTLAPVDPEDIFR